MKPERGEELELGFEGSLFQRLGVDFTYFNKKTKDAILARDIAPSGGFPGQQFVNAGQISNHGVELQLNANALNRPNFGLDMSFNVATNKDRIDDLGGISFFTLSGLLGTQRHQAGYPIGAWFTKRVVSARYDATTKTAVDLMCDGGPAVKGAPVPCASAPRVYIGSITPKYSGAFTSTATLFKRWQLYAMVDYKGGHKIFDWDRHIRCDQFRVCEAVFRPEKYDPIYVAEVQQGQTGELADRFIHDASFAKLREVSVTYQLPDRLMNRVKVGRTSLTLSGRNLHTWTKWTSLDPESRSQVQSLANFTQAVMPELQQFIGTLRVAF